MRGSARAKEGEHVKKRVRTREEKPVYARARTWRYTGAHHSTQELRAVREGRNVPAYLHGQEKGASLQERMRPKEETENKRVHL